MTPKPKPTPASQSARVDPNPKNQSDNNASRTQPSDDFQHPPVMPVPPFFSPAQWQGWCDPNAFPPPMGPHPMMTMMDHPGQFDLNANAASFHPGGAPTSAPAPMLPPYPMMWAPPPPHAGPPPPPFLPTAMPVPPPEGFCPPIGQMIPPPPPTMPASDAIQHVGTLGGMHCHVKMQDLVSLLENTQIKAKKEAVAEYKLQAEEEEKEKEEAAKAGSEQTELLQQVLGYVKGIHEHQENQKLREEETKQDNQQLHAMMKEMLEHLKEIKSQMVDERSQDNMEDLLGKTQIILDRLDSSRELGLGVARVLPIVSSAIETTTEIAVQQQKDSVVLANILDQQAMLNKLVFDAWNSRQNPNKNGKKSSNHNNQSKRGFGRHGQENRAP